MGWAEWYLLLWVGVTLKQRNVLKKDELELQLYGFVGGYISTFFPLELSDSKETNQLGLFYYLYFVRHSTQWLSNMKGFHPNPQRDGYNLAGLHWIVAMIKYRRQIVAYTFRKYTRYHIRQLFSNQFNDNNLFLSIKHVALPTGFSCRILNLGNSKSHIVKYLFVLKSLSISIGGETMTAQITFPFLQQPPPPRLSILELKQMASCIAQQHVHTHLN